nr:regulator of G-protein signaling 8 [Odocoileus virginianus texanus]
MEFHRGASAKRDDHQGARQPEVPRSQKSQRCQEARAGLAMIVFPGKTMRLNLRCRPKPSFQPAAQELDHTRRITVLEQAGRESPPCGTEPGSVKIHVELLTCSLSDHPVGKDPQAMRTGQRQNKGMRTRLGCLSHKSDSCSDFTAILPDKPNRALKRLSTEEATRWADSFDVLLSHKCK